MLLDWGCHTAVTMVLPLPFDESIQTIHSEMCVWSCQAWWVWSLKLHDMSDVPEETWIYMNQYVMSLATMTMAGNFTSEDSSRLMKLSLFIHGFWRFSSWFGAANFNFEGFLCFKSLRKIGGIKNIDIYWNSICLSVSMSNERSCCESCEEKSGALLNSSSDGLDSYQFGVWATKENRSDPRMPGWQI